MVLFRSKAVQQPPPIPRPSFFEEAQHAATHPDIRTEGAYSRTINDLPMPTLEKIFEFLTASDLARCATCCRAWRASASWSPHWSRLCQARWELWSVGDWHSQAFEHTYWPAAWRDRLQASTLLSSSAGSKGSFQPLPIIRSCIMPVVMLTTSSP